MPDLSLHTFAPLSNCLEEGAERVLGRGLKETLLSKLPVLTLKSPDLPRKCGTIYLERESYYSNRVVSAKVLVTRSKICIPFPRSLVHAL